MHARSELIIQWYPAYMHNEGNVSLTHTQFESEKPLGFPLLFILLKIHIFISVSKRLLLHLAKTVLCHIYFVE